MIAIVYRNSHSSLIFKARNLLFCMEEVKTKYKSKNILTLVDSFQNTKRAINQYKNITDIYDTLLIPFYKKFYFTICK